MKNEELVSVKERLENLKKNPKPVPRPFDLIPERDPKPIGEGMLTFERLFQQKVEKAINKIDSMKKRMITSDMFVNYFYDLKRAEKEFLDLLKEAEGKHVDFPSSFLKKIDAVKAKIRSRIR